jgi:hypothetical protein
VRGSGEPELRGAGGDDSRRGEDGGPGAGGDDGGRGAGGDAGPRRRNRIRRPFSPSKQGSSAHGIRHWQGGRPRPPHPLVFDPVGGGRVSAMAPSARGRRRTGLRHARRRQTGFRHAHEAWAAAGAGEGSACYGAGEKGRMGSVGGVGGERGENKKS